MNTPSDCEIYSSRALHAPLELVYRAFADPKHLQTWWGPNGFTNTIHEFDLRAGGKWLLTMHGPEKGNYENASIFTKVVPNALVAWTRTSQPFFDMEVAFEPISAVETAISFRMVFETVEACQKMRPFVAPKNEENFDRLERALRDLSKNNDSNDHNLT